MNPPAKLADWVNAMEHGTWMDATPADASNASQIMENLRADTCVSTEVEDRFWNALFTNWSSASPRGASPLDILDDTVTQSNPSFLLTGQNADSARFARLKRITSTRALRDLLPEGMRTSFALDELDLENPEKWNFRTWQQVHEALAELHSSKKARPLVKEGAIAWATDANESNFTDASDAINSLGLPHIKRFKHVVEIQYDRPSESDAPLKTPRCLDAHDFAAFRPNPNCAEGTGWTHPLPPLTAGDRCPEVVHKAVAMPVECRILS